MIAVVPVPLHRRKQAQRGFNQAEMIARAALKALARPKRFELCRQFCGVAGKPEARSA